MERGDISVSVKGLMLMDLVALKTPPLPPQLYAEISEDPIVKLAQKSARWGYACEWADAWTGAMYEIFE